MNLERKVRAWSLIGFFTIVLLGSLFHFVFEWTNRSALAGIFVPVNESVWEHLKLGFWGVIVFSGIEYWSVSKLVNNYFFSKGLGVITLSITILVIYYSYTSIVGRNILFFDIVSFIVGVLFCQFLVYKLYKRKPLNRFINVAGIVFLFLMAITFALLTYFPPHKNLFKDKTNNTYGIKMEQSINHNTK